VLVIPIAFVSDHVETVFELGIEVRHQATEAGIEQFEVTEGLNEHPSFIEALADVTFGQIRADGAIPAPFGSASSTVPARFRANERKTCCHQCLRITEARKWVAAAAPVGPEVYPIP
jgi:ferrochelatase